MENFRTIFHLDLFKVYFVTLVHNIKCACIQITVQSLYYAMFRENWNGLIINKLKRQFYKGMNLK